MSTLKHNDQLADEPSASLRAELRAVVPTQKHPPSHCSDFGLVQADLENWNRLPAAFVRTPPEELRRLAGMEPSREPSRALGFLRTITKPLTQEQVNAIAERRYGPSRENASSDDGA